MIREYKFRIQINLLSDTIFGSGYSIPAAEDIGSCVDKEGYPYLKGSTFKGVFRESFENIVSWEGINESIVSDIFGEADWSGVTDETRLHLTDFVLKSRTQLNPEDCFTYRSFTSIEDGVAADGTLRVARCILRGMSFIGEMSLQADESTIRLLKDASLGIKFMGTLRSRGFGRVNVLMQEEEITRTKPERIGEGNYIHYRLLTKTPVIMTSTGESQGNSYETRHYITGSSVRGMVLSTLASRNPRWFEEHKIKLLEETVFSDTIPNPTVKPAIPPVKGYYEDKLGENFQNVLLVDTLTPGVKRSSLGNGCIIENGKIKYWSTETETGIRIQRNIHKGEDSNPFQTRQLSAGQSFEGYVYSEDSETRSAIHEILQGIVWIGADRYEGFGQCLITNTEITEKPAYWKYGYQKQSEISQTLYLLAVSPLCMRTSEGINEGLDLTALADLLGVSEVSIERCSTSSSLYGGYNRIWKARTIQNIMYDPGSIFKIHTSEVPSLNNILAIQNEGLGIRKEEGYGNVLFLNPELFKSICFKEVILPPVNEVKIVAACIRRARMKWIMTTADRINGSIGNSRSQLGNVQAMCKKALREKNARILEDYLASDNKLEQFRKKVTDHLFSSLYSEVLSPYLEETDSSVISKLEKMETFHKEQQLRLLSDVLDYARKEEQ